MYIFVYFVLSFSRKPRRGPGTGAFGSQISASGLEAEVALSHGFASLDSHQENSVAPPASLLKVKTLLAV